MTKAETLTRKQVGTTGEYLVQKYLESQGWRVVAANYRCRQGEMDIIAEEPTPSGTVLAFIEVKTRRGRSHGAPIEAVDTRKAEKLAFVAQSFLAERNQGGEEPACRFDVAEIQIGPDGLASVQLQRGVFTAG